MGRFLGRLPWSLSAILASALIVAMILVVHATSLVPIAGVPLATTYSWAGSFSHTLWSLVFIILTAFFSRILARSGMPEVFRAPLETGFTLVILGWLFFNSFFQMWTNHSHFDFLRAIFSW